MASPVVRLNLNLAELKAAAKKAGFSMIKRNKPEAQPVELNTWLGVDPSHGGVSYVLVGDLVTAREVGSSDLQYRLAQGLSRLRVNCPD